ncbi:MAG: peptidylprolyl isomerase [Ilumatobacteraceae bacterium]|nr:peptidylprolyl isomerase [Ilumatobacteraceae bacterium]
MKRSLLAIGLMCLGVLMFATPCSAYTPPETDPRIVISTSRGTILVALAPENAPQHVKEFLTALGAGDFKGANVARVESQYYAQIVGKLGTAQLAALPVEREKVGNLRGAFSVYDSGKPGEAPTLIFVVVKSPQLDPDYTSIGFVEGGMSIVKAITDTPTVGDHQPTEPITITEVHIATPKERALLRQAEATTGSNDEATSLLAAIFIVACAAFVAAIISAFYERIGKQRAQSLALIVALLTFFAVWVAVGGTTHGHGLVGVVLFGGAIAIFRLMGRFERPAQVASGQVAQPRQLADGELNAETGVDHVEGELEIILREGDATAGRSARARG